VEHKSDAALLIVAHGSTVNPDSSAPTLAHAAEIRRRKIFADVECAFWKEEPSLRDAIFLFDPESIRQVYVVPNFISEGKYAEAQAEYRAVLKLREKVLGPEHPDTLLSRDQWAWILATCPEAKIRNGSEAMALAANVCELSQWSDATYLETLAAAEAEAGLFDAAVKHQQQALELAKADKVDVKDLESRLSLYQQHKPYRTAALP
jgi:tetratricopeptide (TPR) repeat protein